MIPAPRQAADKLSPDEVERLAVAAAALAADGANNPPLGELYERYVDVIYRYVARKLADKRAAEDLTSEVWLRVARAIRTYTTRGPGSFTAWLFTIANRLVATYYRNNGRRRESLTADMLAVDIESDDLSPVEVAERHETARAMEAAVSRLTVKHRECVVLRFYHGLSLAETAEVMGVTVNCVKQMQFRALGKLRTVLPMQDRNQVYAVDVVADDNVAATTDADPDGTATKLAGGKSR
jgi:RNA polymerase sigma-70 factor (ECF subfamily)